MFGYIIAGQLPNTNFERVSETEFLSNLTVTSSALHIVVFVSEPFPEGYGGAIYFNWPNPEPTWQYLGYISNSKPSAIFKASQLKSGANGPGGSRQMFGVSAGGNQPQLGISALQLSEIEQLTAANDSSALTVSSNVLFVQTMLENLYNYLSSFAVTQQQMTASSEHWVKVSAVNQWYERFKTRMTNNPNFWKK
ncbi:protein Hikeshi-like [Bolinopsis microptera]|uniref:protein Hikeshi-like n=1 Tax=Bolinopsis microptera TaxID=2820187 RepID=UPI003078A88A